MEKIEIKLDSESEIILKLSINKVKEFVEYLEMDEILDFLAAKLISECNQVDTLIGRLCNDYPEKITELLEEFFNHKSDANKYLLAEQQDNLLENFQNFLAKR